MLRDILFPKTCVMCGFWGSYICLGCEKKLQKSQHSACLYCERTSLLGSTHTDCKKESGVDGVVSLYSYNPLMRLIIKNIKYKGAFDIFNEFLRLIKPEHIEDMYLFRRFYPIALLQPIPLHDNKKKARGFNQSEIIARYFSSILGYPIIDLLKRTRETKAQAQIKERRIRYTNMNDAFQISDIMKPPKYPVILVDDVVTTGSTAQEAARVLKLAGAKEVYVFSLARG